MDKTVRGLIRQLRRLPGVEVRTGRGHPKVFKDGVWITTLPLTPSKPSWYQNALATLKRGGIEVVADSKGVARKEIAMATAPQEVDVRTAFPSAPDFLAQVGVDQVKQISAPATTNELETRKRAHSGGPAVVSKSEARELRRALRVFLADTWGWPEERGGIYRFSHFLGEYGPTYTTETGKKPIKNANTALVLITDFLAGKRGVTVSSAEFLYAGMAAYVEPAEVAEPAEVVEPKTKKPRQLPKETLRGEDLHVNPYEQGTREQKLWDQVYELVLQGKQPTLKGFPKRRCALLADVIKEAATREGIRTESAERISWRLYTFLYATTRSKRSGKNVVRMPQYRTLDEIELFLRLAQEAPLVAEPARTPVDVPIASSLMVDFVSLIEGRALSREELAEAWSLVELQAEFKAAHPRN